MSGMREEQEETLRQVNLLDWGEKRARDRVSCQCQQEEIRLSSRV